ncbi:branched-chain amino acid ABC transporter, permease protein [Marvinbryantia formatexigens DSM 14469]|uniref:Autoinducer 2 import system permease protein LsrD n=1 Tax=Marvinbryantia formatexigens DSM 14469 TaxID=478749 RepID=C6LB55_9FIRM|nr:ABC transporter permease [Marvinbryantia formatexigens]EET62186.1 branched-chain amino acid ABC transporter, permease protein [Marvinbryantia formatexigens DSM 14469]UWO26479.1 ABC transporter permease [Marvinbryantia formatexigens DSM 14469]SDF79152.1 ribose transport system permease protein [Marvinbryantia formatexigens]
MEAAIKKEIPRLSAKERVAIIKNKPSFSLIFSVAVLVLIVLMFGAVTGGDFFGGNVLKGIFNQALIIGTMATAVSFIYTTGNLDISVGNAMALAATLGALAYNTTESIVCMVAVCITAGTLLLLFNCTLSVVFRIKTITVAIVMIQLYSAIVSEILGPNSIKVDYAVCKMLENAGFRYAAFIGYFVLCIIVYHFTPVGRKLRFVGGNANCAQQTGISAKATTYISFLMAGIGVGVAAVFTIIRTGSVSTEVGSGMGMDVMLATVLGGMSIFGGARSNAYAGLLGALTVSALNKGLLMADVSSTAIQGVRGVIFLALVFLNSERPATLPSRQQV